MIPSPEIQQPLKIVDIVPIEYKDFLTYCNIIGKIFSHEITSVDYVAYRSQFGRDKSEVKRLRSIIEAGVMLDKSEIETKERLAFFTPKEEFVVKGAEKTVEKSSLNAQTIVGGDDAESNQMIDDADDTSEPKDTAEESEYTYADIFGLNADDYADIMVETDLYTVYSVSLSLRSLNALRKNGYLTLKKLLLSTPTRLSQIKSLGAKSIKEIENGLRDISYKGIEQKTASSSKPVPSVRLKVVRPIIESMLCGNQYILDELTESEKCFFAKSLEAADVLGDELCIELLHGDRQEYVKSIITMFADFNHKITFNQNIVDLAKAAMANWDCVIYSNWILPFMRLYCVFQNRLVSQEFKTLMKQGVTVKHYADLVERQLEILEGNVNVLANELTAFQTWMGEVELTGLCRKTFDQNDCKNTRVFDVLSERASGHTLEEIAQQCGLTRERVRQLEKKAFDIIRSRLSENRYNLLGLISAYRNGEHVLLKDEIIETIGIKYGNMLWHCATRTEDKGKTYLLDTNIAHYDSNYDAIIVFSKEDTENALPDADNRITEEVVNSLPDLIETVELKRELESRAREYGLSSELFMLVAAKQYRETGLYSYRERLTVVQMCDCVLKKRFQNGYKIADETDGGQFVKYLVEFFGEKGHMTPRAIDAKVMDYGVLIDRGKYIHRDYITIDRSIVDEIFAYIESSPKSALAYYEIFAALEDLFKGTAITNRYALQGIMKLYNCPYASHRDYISKERNVNVADELNAFVEAAGILHKSEIFAEFPGWRDYNLAFVLPRCPDVIGLDNGYFMHASRLIITEDDRDRIKKYLDANIHDIPVSARYLQDEFMNLFPKFMIRNDIQSHGKLFGILQHMFVQDYHFSRPYIAKENIGEITNKFVLLKHLEGMDTIELNDFVDLCKQNAVHYVSLSYLLDIMQPEFVRVDENTLRRFESIGINEGMYQTISDNITEATAAHNGYLAVVNIKDFSWYPTLNIPWTPFLLESIASIISVGINTIKMMSSSFEVPHSIFVCDDYADDDWNSLLVKLLKAEHAIEPFVSKTAVLEWLQAEGLCNVKYPAFLDTENHIYFDENGKLRIE